jgi:hypothetical protein
MAGRQALVAVGHALITPIRVLMFGLEGVVRRIVSVEDNQAGGVHMRIPLVIVPCGQQKIWGKLSGAGGTAARDAYTGSPFKVNRAYAEQFARTWLVLSAKYGFIEPSFVIPGPYNVTFKKKSSGPISFLDLRSQVREMSLDSFESVVGLGGKEYREAIEASFAGSSVLLHFPFSGLKIGKAMQMTKRAIEANKPF